jgi:DNA-binding Lrp family transcriptional regulator
MLKIDLKDRKILFELDLNCRQSNTKIGKKVGLKKDVVSYRIKKLEKEIIKNYYVEYDTFKLGYNVFRLYINFQNVTSLVKEEIVRYFVNHKNIWSVGTARSEFDLFVIIWIEDIYEFYNFWDRTLEKYEEYFEKFTISIYVKAYAYKKSFLIDDILKKDNRELFNMICGGTQIKIDGVDYRLLNEISENARAPLIELADKIGCSSQNINYRLKNLIKSGIIKAFRVNLNLSNLGLHHYKLDIYLRNHRFKKQMINFLSTKPNLLYMNLAVGWADLEPELVVRNTDELIGIMDEIKEKFPNTIKKQNFWMVEKIYKLRCLPE